MQTQVKQKLISTAKGAAPALLTLAFATTAHAQATVDFSGAQTLLQTVETFVKLAGAIIALIGLIFGIVSFLGGNMGQGFIRLGGGLIAGAVIGFAPTWIASLTGQSVQ